MKKPHSKIRLALNTENAPEAIIEVWFAQMLLCKIYGYSSCIKFFECSYYLTPKDIEYINYIQNNFDEVLYQIPD